MLPVLSQKSIKFRSMCCRCNALQSFDHSGASNTPWCILSSAQSSNFPWKIKQTPLPWKHVALVQPKFAHGGSSSTKETFVIRIRLSRAKKFQNIAAREVNSWQSRRSHRLFILWRLDFERTTHRNRCLKN